MRARSKGRLVPRQLAVLLKVFRTATVNPHDAAPKRVVVVDEIEPSLEQEGHGLSLQVPWVTDGVVIPLENQVDPQRQRRCQLPHEIISNSSVGNVWRVLSVLRFINACE